MDHPKSNRFASTKGVRFHTICMRTKKDKESVEAKPKGALFFQNKFSRQKFSRVIKFSPESVFHKKPNFHSKVGPGDSGESNESKILALGLLGPSQFRGFQKSVIFWKNHLLGHARRCTGGAWDDEFHIRFFPPKLNIPLSIGI